MNTVKENNLQFFRNKAIEIIKKESRFLKNNEQFKKDNAMIRKTKRFLNDKGVEVCPSDKTNRFVVTNSASLLERTESILTDTSNYQKVDSNTIQKIENQANAIIRKTCSQTYSKSDFEKLLATGSQPATFYVTVKDHKSTNDNNEYPLRPIASSIDTPTCKIDWLVTKILSQLIQFVHTNVKNSKSVIDDLKSIEFNQNCPSTFISLDVNNLYPSIPIKHGIEIVSNFLTQHWNDINTFSLSHDNVLNCLKFVSYNHYIKYNSITYRQIRGCPMGARFSPPFAIIYLYHIEQAALEILATDHQVTPQYHATYIDDIILGPFNEGNPQIIDTISNVFNSISEDIKFTVEVPREDYLNFLDVSIALQDNRLRYKWYVKNMHSGISLNKDSWVPKHVKTNYVRNSKKYVVEKCSDQETRNEALCSLNRRFKQNGFTNRDISCKPNNRNEVKGNYLPFKINFISDSCNRKLNKLIKQCNLPVKLVSKPGPTLANILKNKMKSPKHTDCRLCNLLPNNLSCNDRFVVYKFTCNLCNEMYIGQTNRPFFKRFNEHKRDMVNKNKRNALYEHAIKVHSFNDMTISHFDVDVIDKNQNAVDCRLTEARLIKTLKPTINRKNELPNF